MKTLASLAAIMMLMGCTPVALMAPIPQTAIDPAVGGAIVIPPPPGYAAAGLAMEQAGRISYRQVPRAIALRICEGSGACSFAWSNGNCRITISTDYTPDFRAAMINHERAHCAGWPSDHQL